MTSLDDRLSQVPIGQIADKSTRPPIRRRHCRHCSVDCRPGRPSPRTRLILGTGSPLGATKGTSGNNLVAPMPPPIAMAIRPSGWAVARTTDAVRRRHRTQLGGLPGSSGKNVGIGGAIGEALAGNAGGALARTFVGGRGTIAAATPAALCVTARWANGYRPVAINPLLRAEPLHSVWLSNADVGI